MKSADEIGPQVDPPRDKFSGPLAWMARNSVAANILMIVLLAGGVILGRGIKQEVFPEFDLDLILVQVPYPGASPAEVEQGVSLAIEESVRGLEGIKEVRSTNTEGNATIVVELMLGTDVDNALNEIKASVDRISSFPDEIERPNIFRASNRFEVISLVLYGDQSAKTLRALAEQARDGLLDDDRITYVELYGVRPLEVSVEVTQENLRRYGLTVEQVAQIIRQSSVEMPGGGVKTDKGEVLLRTSERRHGADFGEITVLSMPDGSELKVADIAEVDDGYAETDQEATFNGMPAVMIKVFRSGSQTPIDVSDAVKDYIADNEALLPPGVAMATWKDMSEFYEQRLDLLMRNAYIGLVLVLLVLGLFLEVRLAFWVTLGIPISFVGSMVFLPYTDISINMISLFAFILVLGMVVDDAIIVGEETYKRRQEGYSRLEAAILGVKSVFVPVSFAVLTTIIFYAPMLYVPGPAGKFFRVIPIVVISTLIVSVIESMLILPAHLAHSKRESRAGFFAWIARRQATVARGLEWLIDRTYIPSVRFAVRRRYLVFALGLATLIGSVGFIAGGRIKMIFMPTVEGDEVVASLEMPYGTPPARTKRVQAQIEAALKQVLEEHGGEAKLSRGIFSQIAGQSARPGDPSSIGRTTAGHQAEVGLFMVDAGRRDITAKELTKEWRAKLTDIAGIEKLTFVDSTGMTGGAPIAIRLSHSDMAILERAADELTEHLESYAGAFDFDDGFTEGKEQIDFKLTPEARSLGITEFELGRQVRSAFFGTEAVRQQRGREEVRVFVRLARAERESEYNVENLLIRPPSGGEIPLAEAAEVVRGRSYTKIYRVDSKRTVMVTADLDETIANSSEVMQSVVTDFLPGLLAKYPGLVWRTGGQQQEMGDMKESLSRGFMLALILAVALLAVAFRSYVQPLIVIIAIPFGFVGALWGHVAMGFDFSMMSWMGIVALAGVVVNDSLILVVAINEYRGRGMEIEDAVVAAGGRRFRPILLTSLTTFFGLAPMILETSVQARFLVPMAISLGFGVMFATAITLIIVPSVFMIVDDGRRLFKTGWEVSKVIATGRYKVAGEILSGRYPAIKEVSDGLPRAVAEFSEDDD